MDNIDLAVQRLHTSGVALVNIGWIIDGFDVESFLNEQVEFINPSATRQKVLGRMETLPVFIIPEFATSVITVGTI